MSIKEIKDWLILFCKEFKEFIDQLFLLLMLIKETKNAPKDEFLKAIKEFGDMLKSAKGLNNILTEITWSGNGYSALISFLKYNIMRTLPRPVRYFLSKYAAKKIRNALKQVFPKPNNVPNVNEKEIEDNEDNNDK